MSLTRKDYTAIAKIISTTRTAKTISISELLPALCAYIAKDNPTFNMEKFIAACKKGEVK